eukprot:c17676_g1_i1 orf=215-475(-)
MLIAVHPFCALRNQCRLSEHIDNLKAQFFFSSVAYSLLHKLLSGLNFRFEFKLMFDTFALVYHCVVSRNWHLQERETSGLNQFLAV